MSDGADLPEDDAAPWERPIPKHIPFRLDWRDIPIEECGEPLVPLGALAGREFGQVFTSSVYGGEHDNSPYGEGLAGSLLTVFAREGVARRILGAEMLLQRHFADQRLHLVAYDIYRPVEVQAALRQQYEDQLLALAPGLTAAQVEYIADKYMSRPSADPARPSPHLTGASVDWGIYRLSEQVDKDTTVLFGDACRAFDAGHEGTAMRHEGERATLLAQNAVEFDMGVPYDWGDKEAAAAYFETTQGDLDPLRRAEVVRNRRLLYWLGVTSGGNQFPSEGWHVNFGNQMAGQASARYGIPDFTDVNRRHEEARRALRESLVACGVDVRSTSLRSAARCTPTEAPDLPATG